MDRAELQVALDIITEGEAAKPGPMLQAVTAEPEAFMAEAAAVADDNRPWVIGPGVQGVGIGEKIKAGRPTGELSLRVYVEHKQPETELTDAVPRRIPIRGLDDVPTDVIEIGRLDHELSSDRVRPLAPGSSVSMEGGPPGTIGGFVHREGAGGVLLLSNSHVLADFGRAPLGTTIRQPASADAVSADTDDRIGELAEFVPFTFGPTGFPNLVDAALATVEVDHENVIRLLEHAPRGVNKRPRVDMRVQKVGRTSDHTIGIIRDVDFRLQMLYPHPDGGKQRLGFRDQILCSRYTAPGDSGSLVLSSGGLALGLHVAGSPTASVFSRIGNVLDAFDVELATKVPDAQ